MLSGAVFTIRNSLLTIVTLLVLGVLAFAGLGAVNAYKTLVHDEDILRMNELSDLLLESAGNWAVERGVTNAALGAVEPVAAARREKILQRRSTADSALSKALDRLRKVQMFPGQEQSVAALEEAFAAMQQIRHEVDLALQVPKEQRDTRLVSSWVPTATALVLKSRDLRVELTQSQGASSLIGQLTALKHFAWVMSEFAGRERAIVGGVVGSGSKLNHTTLQTLNAYRGQVELAWETVRDIAKEEGLPPAVSDAIDRAQATYFGTFQQTREAVYDGGVNRVAYPTTGIEWIEKATVAIDAILKLQDTITQAWYGSGLAPEANALTEDLITAAGNWAVERGATNAALNAEAQASDDVLRIIDSRRGSADEAFKSGLKRLSSGFSFAGKHQSLQEVEDAYQAVIELRARLDGELSKPKSQRESELARSWVPTATRLIIATQDLRVSATRAIGASDPRIAAYLGAKHSTWVMAEFAGRERAIVAGVIASGKHFSAEQFRRLSEYRGWVESAWASIIEFGQSPTTAATVGDAIAEVENAFFEVYGETRAGIYDAEAKGAAYPLTGADWIAAATDAINSLLAVQQAAGEATAEIAEMKKTEATTTLFADAFILALAAIMALICVWVIMQRIVRPLRGMTAAMDEISHGNLAVDVPSAERADEIGNMARALQIFKDNLFETERLREQQKEQEAKAEEERSKAMMELADFFETTVKDVVEGVANTSTNVKSAAEAMSRTAGETSERSTAVASASEEATVSVRTVATAAAELSKSISEISQRVGESSQISGTAANKAQHTNEEVSQLAEAASRIGNVVELISDIAEQTNLLALNATIEAARAGEAGKGFAVVAHEVKSLATQTANATGEIAQQINQIQGATDKAVDSIKEIVATIEQVNEIATGIASAVEEQGSATQEISRSVDEAAAGTQEVTQNIAAVSEAARDTGQSAGDMLTASEELAERSTHLGDEVESFLVRVRESAMGNRRKHHRFKGTWIARGDASAGRQSCTLKDLSLGGALIDAQLQLSPGTEFQLSIDGIEIAIPAKVVEVSTAGTHVQFAESEEIMEPVRAFLEKDKSLAA